MSAEIDTLRTENQLLREEIESLRTALTLKDARARFRDGAKHETTQMLGISDAATIHEILAEIRSVVDERDRLRRLVQGQDAL